MHNRFELYHEFLSDNEHKEVLVIRTPILSQDVKEFIQGSKAIKTQQKVEEFINQVLFEKFNIQHFKIDSFSLKELLKNSFDAYALEGLVLGEEFVLKISVIQKPDNKILIKIKDNGTGFIGHEKSVQVNPTQIQYQDKENKNLFGGERIGFSLFEKIMKQKGCKLVLKNRKEFGASISIEIPPTKSLAKL